MTVLGTVGRTESKEESHTRGLNARGVGLGKISKMGSRALGTVNTGATFASAVGLDEVRPLDAKNVGDGATRRSCNGEADCL